MMRRGFQFRQWIPYILILIFMMPGQGSAATQLDAPDCSTPYRAVYTWLEWLQQDRWEPEVAASCFDLNVNQLSHKVAVRRVAELKEVIDARGWWIPLDDFPDTNDYVDPLTKEARFQVLPQVPEVYLEYVRGSWRFNNRALEVTPSLYQKTFSLDLQNLIDHAPSWLLWHIFGVAGWQYLGLLLLLGLSFPIGRLVGWILSRLVRGFFAKIKFTWGEALLARTVEPMRLLGSATVVWVLLPQLRLAIKANMALLVAVKVFAAYSVIWACYRAVDVFAEFLTRRADATDTRLDDQLVPLVRKSMKIITVVLGLLFILQNLNVDVQSLVAGLGIGGLAFALAAKDTLANLFGSVTIFLDRPFQIGDWVILAGVEGVVESVGFRSTRIRTFADSVITMPNAQVADAVINNMGERKYRRVKAMLNLTYDTSPDQMQAFVEGVRAILKASQHIRQDFYEVHFVNFGAHSLDVLLYAFVQVKDWSEELTAKHNLFLEIMRLAEEIGVEFAFPTQTLHMESVAEPRPMGGKKRYSPQELRSSVEAFGPGGRLSRPDGPEISDGFFADANTQRGSAE